MNTGSVAPRKPLLYRLFMYQSERFPLAVHVPLIAAFSFSAIAYSRLCRQVPGFISWTQYLACVATNLMLFFLLRVADEHKDRQDDARYRAYLPVPRGLVSLRELRVSALLLLVGGTLLNICCFPALLPLYVLMTGYLLLMRYEFFMAAWLRRHQLWYNISHMFIIPLADMYASGYDWKLHHAPAPAGLLFFFGVSYLNGMVLEIGRKIRTKEQEEPGVVSYSSLLGYRRAALLWTGLVLANASLAWMAARYAHHGRITFFLLPLMAVATLLPALLFCFKPTRARAKSIELLSLLWALGMYLTLGGWPLLHQLFFP